MGSTPDEAYAGSNGARKGVHGTIPFLQAAETRGCRFHREHVIGFQVAVERSLT